MIHLCALGTQPCLQANAIYLELERMGESFEQLLHTGLPLSVDWLPLRALIPHRLPGMGEKQAAASLQDGHNLTHNL